MSGAAWWEVSLPLATAGEAPIKEAGGTAGGTAGTVAGGRGGLLEFCFRRSDERPLPTADAAELLNRLVMLYELTGDGWEEGGDDDDDDAFAPPVFESTDAAAPPVDTAPAPAPPVPPEDKFLLPDTPAFMPSICTRLATAISDSTVTSALALAWGEDCASHGIGKRILRPAGVATSVPTINSKLSKRTAALTRAGE